jgi:hypothetical protein
MVPGTSDTKSSSQSLSEHTYFNQERRLTEDEIVASMYEHPSSRLAWTVHRPQRGWYLRVRSPAFPPNAHVALCAIPRTSPNFLDGALTFGCRTNVPPPTLRDDPTASAHSYPPTPPTVSRTITEDASSPRSRLGQSDSTTALAASSSTTLAASSTTTLVAPSPPPAQASQITEFRLAPQPAVAAAAQAAPSLLARAFATLRTAQPVSTLSFELTRLPRMDGPPLLAFHDHTRAFSVASTTGVLELDTVAAQALGVHPSFWVTVALAYLEFLEDREVRPVLEAIDVS